MSVYYNENDPKAAAWLRMLIQEGVIPQGVVDERSIHDVKARELRGFTQCHFFAGIGGWAEALRLAGWGERPVWTGSCPCQPFSAAGKGLGQDDPRHLWPIWFELIRQCRPLVIFGEQVASRAALSWLDTVQDDLESEVYALGAVDLCAAGVGAPHIRQRLYWVAECAISGRIQTAGSSNQERRSDALGDQRRILEAATTSGRMAEPNGWYASPEWQQRSGEHGQQPEDGGFSGLANALPAGRAEGRSGSGDRSIASCGAAGILAYTELPGSARLGQHGGNATGSEWVRNGSGPGGIMGNPENSGCKGQHLREKTRRRENRIAASSPWSNCEWLYCTDGKQRPVEPGSQCVVDGLSQDMANCWDESLCKIQKEVIDYAATKKARPNQVLRALRGSVQPQFIQWCSGRFICFQTEALLFAALCELERQLGQFIDGETSSCSETLQTELREMWLGQEPTGSSPRSQLSEQFARQLTNIVCELPQEIASSIIHGFPLASKIQGRVGLLRGYGNAIIPEAAAEFVTAYLEIR